jgi:pimeloyl-ACP methyl ester carboxylesterase
MRKFLYTTILTSLVMLQSLAVSAVEEEKFIFTSVDKQETEAFRGELEVPENRANPNSRMIPLRYVRFAATTENAGPPIIYLSGGPGGSGIQTAKYRRYDMFMALRAYGDVIALDQRGSGASDELPVCEPSQIEPAVTIVSDADYVELHRQALRECLEIWKSEDVDIKGYNTLESARDLDALRQHLGAEEMVLWGISYGSHLAFAALNELSDKIDRVVLSSGEGLDQTIKMPARTDAYFDRLQQAVDSQPEAKAVYGDIKTLIKRVHSKLAAEPVLLHLAMPDGSVSDLLFQRHHMQTLASYMVSDPTSAGQLLGMYHAMDNGITAPFEQFLGRAFAPGKSLSMRAMSAGMDIASGMTAGRKVKIAQQAKTALLRDYLNFTYHFDGVAPELDLGDGFRVGPYSDVPVLLFSGTLDGRTYIESQHEAVAGLKNVTLVTVKNAGHNLYMSSPEVQDAINHFMEGKAQPKTTITIDLPNLASMKP